MSQQFIQVPGPNYVTYFGGLNQPLSAPQVTRYSPFAFGAVGDGVTNDAAAFTAAFAAIPAGSTLYATNATFFIGTNFTVPKGYTLFFENAKLLIATGITVTFIGQIGVSNQFNQIFQTTSTDVQPVKFGNPGTFSAPNAYVASPNWATPMWWGADPTNTNDSWPAFQQCIYAFGYNPNPVPLLANFTYGTSGTIYVPTGSFKISKSLLFGAALSGVSFIGAGRGLPTGVGIFGTGLNFTAVDGSDGITVGGETITSPAQTGSIDYFSISGFSLSPGPSAGVPLHFLDAVKCKVFDMVISSTSTKNACWLNGGAVNGTLSNISIEHCVFTSPAGTSVPILVIDGGSSTVGQCSEISVFDCEFLGSMTATAPQVLVNNVGGTGIGIQNIRFETIRFEVPYAGAFWVNGALNVSLRHATAGDTGSLLSAPTIRLRKGPGANQLCNGFSIDQFWSDMGSPTNATIDFDNSNSGQLAVAVFNTEVNYVNGGTLIGGPQLMFIASALLSASTGNPPTYYATVLGGGNGLAGLGSISSTQVFGGNLAGTMTIASAATGSVTFVQAEADTNYRILIGPPAGAALPAAGSERIQRIVKTTSGFTVTLEVAATQTQTYDWFCYR